METLPFVFAGGRPFAGLAGGHTVLVRGIRCAVFPACGRAGDVLPQVPGCGAGITCPVLIQALPDQTLPFPLGLK